MNLFQLVTKQMRQRALSTWLTLLSVLLGVGLAIAIMILRREGAALFGQTDYGYDVLVGPRGSDLTLVLNTAYHIEQSLGNIPYSIYEDLTTSPRFRPMVRTAVPFAVGDNYEGNRVIGTLPKLFGYDDAGNPLEEHLVPEYRPGRRYQLAEGRVFHPRRFEAVIGSEIPHRTGLKLGSTFQVAHGLTPEGQTPDIHEETWTVVGILEKTGTANDRVLFIPLTSFYTIQGHEEALEQQFLLREGPEAAAKLMSARQARKDDHAEDEHAEHDHDEHDDHAGHDHDHDDHAHDDHAGHDHHDHEKVYELTEQGEIELTLPKEAWQVSAIAVRSRGGFQAMNLIYQIRNAGTSATAVNPAQIMRDFFQNVLGSSLRVLLLITILVTVVAGVGILVSIYNSVSARLREIAILRALGATRLRVLALICLEAGLIGLVGGLLGLLAGHAIAAVISGYLQAYVGEGINWWTPGVEEWVYLGAVVVLAVLAGLVPALKAYRTPVATNLVSA